MYFGARVFFGGGGRGGYGGGNMNKSMISKKKKNVFNSGKDDSPFLRTNRVWQIGRGGA